MRVRFGEHDAAERRALAAFDERADALLCEAVRAPRDGAWWAERVRALDDDLEAELDRNAALVVRPARRAITPLAERFAERARPHFTVLTRRPLCAFADALVELGPRATAFARATARAGFTRGHLIDVVISLPGGSGAEHELELAERLVTRTLGERTADDWIGSIDVAPAPRGLLRVLDNTSAPAGFPIAELKAAIDAAIAGVRAGLPDAPYAERDLGANWALFELTPEPARDWASDDDLLMATSAVPELLKCHLERAPFSSLRFSRHGELFFFLKYRAEGSPAARLGARAALEDALEDALVGARAGRVIGAGLGLGYDYVHFAFGAIERAFELVRAVARAVPLSARSWLLPFDSDLEHEWIEIFAGSPPPPRASDEA